MARARYQFTPTAQAFALLGVLAGLAKVGNAASSMLSSLYRAASSRAPKLPAFGSNAFLGAALLNEFFSPVRKQEPVVCHAVCLSSTVAAPARLTVCHDWMYSACKPSGPV